MGLARILSALEGQFEAQLQEGLREEVSEFAEGELLSVSVAARIRARIGQSLTVRSLNGETVTGIVKAVAEPWVLLEAGGEELIQLASCVSVEPLGHSAPSRSPLESRLTYAYVLRQIARRRIRVRISAGDLVTAGAIVGVYADHIDLRTDTGITSIMIAHIFSVRTVAV
ncbi:MAG: hypothetical protein Q4P71_00820 [Actinomycetaceae bacterium]|nr:hypothetical protein [Actinomycetaceae bacterium]